MFMFGFGISLGPIVWLYLPEILPEKGVSIAALVNWVFTAIVGIIFPIMKDSVLTISGVYWFFCFWMLCAVIFVNTFVVETKGKSPV
mmetsp:Transcript_12053/g.19011  ORF Transcript_12053/g.19011 Transcript_12053/m.19011 type:complete len:87 (+) Transcript_12053:1094-1354(+)